MRAAFACGLFACSAFLTAEAQPAFPSAALASAQTVDQALAVLGVAKPEPSGHLSLDLPDIASAGEVKGIATSLIPGTSQLVLLRGLPAALAGPLQPGRPAAAVANTNPADKSPENVALVAAERFAPGSATSMQVITTVSKTEWFTLLTMAQGRWFYVTREVKIGRAPLPHPQR